MPEVNEAIAMPLGHSVLETSKRRKLSHNLREKRYDRVYVLLDSFKPTLVLFLVGIPHHTGWYGEMRYGLLNNACVLDREVRLLMVEHYTALAYDGGVILAAKDLPQPLLQPQLQVSGDEESLTYSQFSLSAEHPIVGFCPGAEFGPAKCWPHYRYVGLVKQLVDESRQIVLFGSAKDHETGNEILATPSVEQQTWCRSLAGETQLEQAVILLAACKAMVTNDSKLMHMTAALNHSLVALYGPSSLDFTPPLSHRARVIHLITGYRRVCKGDTAEGYHQSLTNITPQHALEELNDLLLREEV